MKIVLFFNFIIAFVFLAGETARRGISYFSINATTMLEDYVAGLLLLSVAILWMRHYRHAQVVMVAALAYATGGMFVPFFAHLEAWIREETFRADHIHTDTNAVILKATVWIICLLCFVVSLRTAVKN